MKKANIKKCILLLVMSAAAVEFGFAQTGEPEDGQARDLDHQVDVSRDYTPSVERAAKLAVTPDMSDTVSLRPDLEYDIRPSAWLSGFGVAAISPARIDASSYEPLHPFYLKVGGGFPGQSLADLYISTTGRGSGSAGFYANHYGHYGKIKNDLGYKEKAGQNNNRVGAFGRVDIGSRLSLAGEIGYDYDMWSLYGQSAPEGTEPPARMESVPKQHYSSPHGKVVFGNSFSDLSYFNFRLGAEGYHVTDKFDNAESGIGAFFEIGKMANVHKLTLKLGFDGTYGADNRSDYSDLRYSVGPRYGVVTDKLKLTLGADAVYHVYDIGTLDDNRFVFLPALDLNFDVTNGWFVPYVKIDGRLINNGLRSISRSNPFAYPPQSFLPDSKEYDFRGGFSGNAGSNFSYNIYGGYTIINDAVCFYRDYFGSGESTYVRMATNDKMEGFTAGAELEGRISGSFMTGVYFRYYDYSVDKWQLPLFETGETIAELNEKNPAGVPDFEASFYLRYNYRDKFFLRAGVDVIGKRRFIETTPYLGPTDPFSYDHEYKYTDQDAVFDLNLEAEYSVDKRFGIFVSGYNLANQKLYPFPGYPGWGTRVDAGIKLKF